MVTAPLIKSGPCSGKRGASTRLVWAKVLRGVVVGYRIGENRGCGRLGIACIGGRFEANVSDRINLARQ